MNPEQLDAIQARITDCQALRFGGPKAHKLAHEDAPALLAYARDLEARIGRVRAEAWDEGMTHSFTLLNAEEFVPSFRKENPHRAALTASDAS